ncbi:MAG: enoyl-CoA hydratase, partial [Actinomycetota bacterium]
ARYLTLCQMVSSDEVVLVSRHPVEFGHVAAVTLNRPEARNAIDAALGAALPAAITACDADTDVRAIVLTGADPAFCAGFDLRDVGGGKKRGTNVHPGYWGPLPPTRVPVIGAVNGAAITGGFEIALACDFLIASERAVFADTHAKVGMVPGWGLTIALPRLIGTGRARRMSLTAEKIDAATARDWGLVTEVVAHENLLACALELATMVAGNHAEAVSEIRRVYDGVAPLGDSDEAYAHENAAARAWAQKRFAAPGGE